MCNSVRARTTRKEKGEKVCGIVRAYAFLTMPAFVCKARCACVFARIETHTEPKYTMLIPCSLCTGKAVNAGWRKKRVRSSQHPFILRRVTLKAIISFER
jgi:hypothetical protein